MKNINFDIKKSVKKNLYIHKFNKIHEAYKSIEFVDDNDYIKQYLYKTFDIIKEGYTLNDIDEYFNKKFLNEIETPKNLNLPDINNLIPSNFSSTIWDSIKMQLKEYIIYYILSAIFGEDNDYVEPLSIALKQIELVKLLYIFYDEVKCKQPMTQVIDAILEIIVRKTANNFFKDSDSEFVNKLTGEKKTWSQFFISMTLGNLVGQLISQSETPDMFAEKFCKLIHK